MLLPLLLCNDVGNAGRRAGGELELEGKVAVLGGNQKESGPCAVVLLPCPSNFTLLL